MIPVCLNHLPIALWEANLEWLCKCEVSERQRVRVLLGQDTWTVGSWGGHCTSVLKTHDRRSRFLPVLLHWESFIQRVHKANSHRQGGVLVFWKIQCQVFLCYAGNLHLDHSCSSLLPWLGDYCRTSISAREVKPETQRGTLHAGAVWWLNPHSYILG